MTPELTLIDLDQPLIGQRCFISCWLSRQPELCFIVDPGPPATAAALIDHLRALGVEQLDLILLTHVHLDHAGATAAVLEAFPTARVVAHVRGRPHLLAPRRLWEGSQRVLGATATVYGEPVAVPEAALASFDDHARHGIRSIQTPGHASHHLAFLHEGTLYAGEAAGTFAALPPRKTDGAEPADTVPDQPRVGISSTRLAARTVVSEDVYLRPATPPRFILEVALASLGRLIALDPAPRRIAFAHHGAFVGDAVQLLKDARDQLLVWLETARRIQAEVTTAAASGARITPRIASNIAPAIEPNIASKIASSIESSIDMTIASAIAALLTSDPYFARLERLPADIQQRERQFSLQSLTGMFEYLARVAAVD